MQRNDSGLNGLSKYKGIWPIILLESKVVFINDYFGSIDVPIDSAAIGMLLDRTYMYQGTRVYGLMWLWVRLWGIKVLSSVYSNLWIVHVEYNLVKALSFGATGYLEYGS